MLKGIHLVGTFVIALFFLSGFSFAFDFWGYTYNVTADPINATNVSIYVYNQSWQIVAINSTLSNETGFFNLTIDNNTNYFYKPIINHLNGTDADYVGQTMPEFPGQEIQNMISYPVSFYLKEGATLNITAFNATGDNENGTVSFRYMVKDQKLGYPVAENFQTTVNQSTVYLPADRNYSIMIYPEGEGAGFPVSVDINNLSDYTTPKHVDVKFNTTNVFTRIRGNINTYDGSNLSNASLVNYLIEPGNMIFPDYPMPYNISRYHLPFGDRFYINGNHSFYNISLPGSAMDMKIMMFAIGYNNETDTYYGNFRNITIDASGSSIIGFNFTVYPLIGSSYPISIENDNWETPGIDYKNISCAQSRFQLLNESEDVFRGTAHIEMDINYTSYNGAEFTWMLDVQSQNLGLFRLPMLSGIAVSKMNIYAMNGAPVKTSLSASALLVQPVNITIPSFNPGGIDEAMSDISIGIYRSNSECDVPYPPEGCNLTQENSKSNFKPLGAVIGGGKVSFRMKKNSNNITVIYKNVDLIASGPPDALFDGEGNRNQSDSALEEAWRFGSNGPEIYDEILIGVPYSENDIDENAPVRVSLDNLYNSSWDSIWNIDQNETSEIPSEYSDFNNSWFNKTTKGILCNKTNTTSKCYMNTTYNMIWLTIPHFSGIGPTVNGMTQGNITLNRSAGTIECRESCVAYINATNLNYTLASVLRNITINNSETAGNVVNFSIYWYNGSDYILNGTNDAVFTNYNLTLYNSSDSNTVHQYRINITKNTNASTIWNFTYQVDSLESLIMQFNLECTENWSCGSWSACSGGTQTRTCNDVHNCTTTTNRPSLSRSCNEDSGSTSTTGGTTAATVQKTYRWVNIEAGESVNMQITNSEIGFSEIEITIKNSASNLALTVRKMTSAPSTAGSFSRAVYKYVEVEEENVDENIDYAKIRFSVSKSWLQENDFENAVLMRYANGIWNELETKKINETDTEIIYEALTGGFSYFAISGTSMIIPDEEHKEPQKVVTTEEDTQKEANDMKIPEKENSNMDIYAISLTLIILVFVIIGGIFYYEHGKK